MVCSEARQAKGLVFQPGLKFQFKCATTVGLSRIVGNNNLLELKIRYTVTLQTWFDIL